MWWIVKELKKIIKNTKPDTKIVFCSLTVVWSGLPTLIIGKLYKIKTILRLDAHVIEYMRLEDKLLQKNKFISSIKRFILDLPYRLTLPFYDAVVGISEALVSEAKKYKAKKAVKIYVPIDLGNFIPDENQKNKKGDTILYVGQIKAMKGLECLIEAFYLLKNEENLTPKLVLVGIPTRLIDEIFLEDLKKKAEGLNVEFLGLKEHKILPIIYNQADIFVLPSLSEALGMVIMEAMACEVPVIAFNISGPKELIKDGVNGFLVEPKNSKILKEKLAILLKNPELRKSFGKKGRDTIEDAVKLIDKNYKKLWEYLKIA
jgi:glycosyltransferase involved in cell wall biosynthesis